MTKVTADIFSTNSSPKAARFAGNWLAGAAESRSARRRLNAILRLACRTLGLKRGKGLGMLGVAVAIVVGLASPVMAQVSAESPGVSVPDQPAGMVKLHNGFSFPDAAGRDLPDGASFLEFTVFKGAIITSPNGPVKADGVEVPLNMPLEKDYFFPSSKGYFPANTTFSGPVSLATASTGFALRFPAGTVFPKGTIFRDRSGAQYTPAGVTLGVPTTAEVASGNSRFQILPDQGQH